MSKKGTKTNLLSLFRGPNEKMTTYLFSSHQETEKQATTVF